MKFSASRKINLGNIDPVFQFETEDLGVHDAESPEEATQKLDAIVRDRILHYREVALGLRSAPSKPPVSAPLPNGPAPVPASTSTPVFGTPPAATAPPAPATVGPAAPVTTAGPVSGPPAEFE